MELMQKLVPLAMLVFVLSSMLAMGLGLTVSGIIAPLRDPRRVILSLLANFFLVPLAALALAALLRLDQPLGVGLLWLGSAAGAPFLPTLTQLAKGNLAFAVGLMVLMLLPLASALAFKARFATAALLTKPTLDRISNVSLIVFILLLVAVNFNNVLGVFGTRGILAGLLFIAISFGIGWLLGGPNADARRVLALGTAQRNIAAALVVGSQSFTDPKVVVMVAVVAIVGLLILMPVSRTLARISLPAPETNPQTQDFNLNQPPTSNP